MTTQAKTISITTTRYEGDAAFPEADHWDEYVAEQVAELHPGFEVSVSYGLDERVFVDCRGGRDNDDIEAGGVEDDIKSALPGMWDDFCAHGYKPYTVDTNTEAAANALFTRQVGDTTMTTRTYSINTTDSETPAAWMGLCTTAQAGEQDSGRVRYTATTEQPEALEAALDADDGVLEYEDTTMTTEVTL
jgi:hypothetical protein